MKPFLAFRFSNHTWMEGVALSSVCGLAYCAEFLLQTTLSSLVNLAQGLCHLVGIGSTASLGCKFDASQVLTCPHHCHGDLLGFKLWIQPVPMAGTKPQF
jgi:hypothetical protein